MRLSPSDKAGEFAELQFKPGTWLQQGIPERGCRMRLSMLERLIAGGGAYDNDELIYGLMDWLDVTDDPVPALTTLKLMLDRHYPADGRTHARCHFADATGPEHIFHAAINLDCTGPIVSWQRRQWVIAFARASDEQGRMAVAAPAPLSLDAAKSIFAHSMTTYMLEPYDSFAGAWASCGRTANFYCLERGQVTANCWKKGLGVHEQDGQLVRDPAYLPITTWLPPRQLAMQVAIALGFGRDSELRAEVQNEHFTA